ncbi:MAG: diguanylate cyclase [Sphingomonadales bacterium]
MNELIPVAPVSPVRQRLIAEKIKPKSWTPHHILCTLGPTGEGFRSGVKFICNGWGKGMARIPWMRQRSFRYWIGMAMVLSIMPVAIAAGAGYLLLKHGVLAPFKDVIVREQEQVGAIQRLQLFLHEIEAPVDIYINDANPGEPAAYRHLRGEIELAFAKLSHIFKTDPEVLSLVIRAREDWSGADQIGAEIMSAPRPPGDSQAEKRMEAFASRISAAADKLGAANARLRDDLDQDYAQALHAYERSEWIAGIAAGIALLCVVAGVVTISRMLLANVDRLVEGANRFAEGDRDYRIQIAVPRELRKVADEFNRMIERIQDAEIALENVAQRDALTGLLNRRTFNGTLQEALARRARRLEPFSLCILDLDHFKKVNDTYGHAAGDEILRVVSRVMQTELREIDKVFRLGGEEFAALLPGVHLEGAVASAERLRLRIASELVHIDGHRVSLTVSAGVVEGAQFSDAETLVRQADKALYRAKADGRNCVRVSD